MMMTPPVTTVQIPRPNKLVAMLFSTPVLLHRLGLGPLLPPMFLIMTAPGRKSGRIYHTALECRSFGDSLWVVSGWGEQTQWYKNLRANPVVTLQHRGQIYAARATFIDDEEDRVRVMKRFRESMGAEVFDQVYGRLFGVPPNSTAAAREQVYSQVRPVRFDRLRNQPAPYAGVTADLLWVWPALAAAFLVGWFVSSRRRT